MRKVVFAVLIIVSILLISGLNGCGSSQTQPYYNQPPNESPQETSNNPISPCDAGSYIGKEKTVVGKVNDGYKSDTNTVFLDFGEDYPNYCFYGVIFSSNLANFPSNPEIYYEGKMVRISGLIQEYQGKPEIILRDMSQIEVITS